MIANTIVRKNAQLTVKEELLNLSGENDTVELEFNITSIINPRETISIVNHEEIMKMQNKKKIRHVAIQGQMLKKVKNKEDFIGNVGLSRLPSILKFRLFLEKSPV